VQSSSTNLANLRLRPLAVLLASPFVVSPVAGLWIVAPMAVAYGELQRWLGRASALVVGVLGHVVGWPGGIAPPGSHRSRREGLPSPGSCHLDHQKLTHHAHWAKSLGYWRVVRRQHALA